MYMPDEERLVSSMLQSEKVDNPAGVILTKPGYFMYPPITEIKHYMDDNGRCLVEGLTIGRYEYGCVYFPGPVDITNMNFDQIVQFRRREINVYPDNKSKPPFGEGLNRRATVTLNFVYPKWDVSLINRTHFVNKLKIITEKKNCQFVEYRPRTGSWVFEVKHFSRYGFTESDEEEWQEEVAQMQNKKDDREAKKGGLGGGLQLLGNPPESPTVSNFEGIRQTDSAIQNIKSSLFTNLEFTPKPGKGEGAIFAAQVRGEVIATPKVYKLSDISLLMPPMTQRCYMDLGVFRDNTYKVGWGVGLEFYDMEAGARSEKFYDLLHCRMDIKGSRQYNCMMPNLIELLNATFEHSDFSFENDIPTLSIRQDIFYLRTHTKLFNEHAEANSLTGQEKYLCNVWNLCSALWGPGDNSCFSRRRYLSDWLKKAASDMSPAYQTIEHSTETQIFQTIFILLSFHEVSEACRFALRHKMSRLASLISQISANQPYKYWIQEYLYAYTWKETDAISDEFGKVYLILSGVPVHNEINICDGLDWMRNFGLHLWYMAPVAAPIDVAFNAYKRAFEEVGYATKPIPPYCHSEIETNQYDLLYEIIGLYTDGTGQLCKVLHPETHTANLMDYRLSWFLLHLFRSLNTGLISNSEKEYLHTTFSAQLENMGLWKWAIYVLLYLENNTLKKNLVFKILEKNVSPFAETVDIERELVQRFKIPAAWIHEVKVIKTQSTGHHYECFQHYIYMGDCHRANTILLEHILPELFINGQYDDLEKFLKKLQPFADNLVNWDSEAGLFLDYLHLQKILSREQREGQNLMLSGRMLASMIKRIGCFPVKNEQQTLCLAELSKESVLIFKDLNKKVQQQEYYANFVAMFRDLFMAPDVGHHEIFHLVMQTLRL